MIEQATLDKKTEELANAIEAANLKGTGLGPDYHHAQLLVHQQGGALQQKGATVSPKHATIHPKSEEDVRKEIVRWALWGLKHTALIHYTQVRPMPLNCKLPMYTDCSGFVSLCYFLAGAPDPNGLNYSGAGYTGTLLEHGKHIPLSEVLPGDLIVYEPAPGGHTALIVGKWGAHLELSHVAVTDDPLTVSHGEESGPEWCKVSQDGREPQTYLRFDTKHR